MLTSCRRALAAFGITVYVLCLLPADPLRSQQLSRFTGDVLLFAALAIIRSEYAVNVRRQIIWQYPGTAKVHLGMGECRMEDGKSRASDGRFPPSTTSFPRLQQRGVDD